MTIDIAEYHEELFQEIHSRADADGRYVEDAFFDVLTESLVDAGEIETADRVHHVSPRGIRVDGYGGDPVNSDAVLSLIITDFNKSHEVATLTATNLNAIFKRLFNFLDRSLDDAYRNSLEESAPVFGLADLIAGPVALDIQGEAVLGYQQGTQLQGRWQGGRPTSGSTHHLQRVGSGSSPPLRNVRS